MMLAAMFGVRCHWNIVVTVICILCFISSMVRSDHQGNLTSKQLNVQEHLDEQSVILEHLLKGYDKRFIPALNRNPVKVELHVKVNDIFSMDDTKMESDMIVFIRQTWYDFRLSHNYSAGKIKVREHLLDKIWLPDIRMSNLKDIKRFHDFGGINMNIRTDGKIYFSQLVLVKISCPMDLRKFPMDKQTCFLNFSSYAYARSLMFFSLSEKKVTMKPVYLPQFDFIEVKKIPDTKQTMVSKVTIALTFQRRSGYYLLQIYIPSIFLVVLSWLAFLMDSSDIADRLALEVTMILSIVFLFGSINTSLPHVSYPKASDWFIVASFTFIFFALLETMLVYRLTSLNTSSPNQQNCLKGVQKCWSNFFGVLKRVKVTTKSSQMTHNRNAEEECSTFDSERPSVAVQTEMKPTPSLAFWVDKICIIAFPAFYVVFNFFYWRYYI